MTSVRWPVPALPWYHRHGLLLLVPGVVVLFLMMVMAGMYYTARETLSRTLDDHLPSLATGCAHLVDRALDGDASRPELVELLRRFRDGHQLDAVLLLDEDRRLVADAVGRSPGTPTSAFALEPVAAPDDRTITALGRPVSRSVRRTTAGYRLVLDRENPLPAAIEGLRHALWVGMAICVAGAVLLSVLVGGVLVWRNRAQTALERASASATAGMMASAIAHEIRNPLSIVRASTQLLGHTADLEPDARLLIEEMQEEIDRASDQIEGFLDLTRELPLRLARFDPADLVDRVGQLLAVRAREAGCRLSVRSTPALRSYRGDRRRLRQALINLGLNAIEACADGRGTHIELELSYGEDALEIVVADDGPGLPADILRGPTEPFLSNKPNGSGLGLAVVRRIVERHGGTLELVNRSSGGALARLRLPAAGIEDETPSYDADPEEDDAATVGR